MRGRVLIAAGSDPSGGAGVQADLKTVTALGAYASAAITALTVQDTEAVHAVHQIGAELIEAQIAVALADIGADCIKLGMIGTVEAAEAILSAIEPRPQIPLVLDPVLVATSGGALGDGAVARAIRERMLQRAALVTPNLPELAALTGMPVGGDDEIMDAAKALLDLGPGAVLAKGGHGAGPDVKDLLVSAQGVTEIVHARIETRHTHGTGCTLASACAAGIAQGLATEEAVSRAIAYTAAAIRHAPGLGAGHGPLNHALREIDGRFVPFAGG